MTPYILIVEDEAILYDGLSQALIKHNFRVSDYTPSYEKAIERIKEEKPDVALLDINLQGDKTGIDLGYTLYKEYNIPFIYITSLDDEEIFQASLKTHHQQFIVKTKPNLNIKQVVRAVETVLFNQAESKEEEHTVWAYAVNVDNPRPILADLTEEVLVRFDRIAYISSEPFINGKEVPHNYIWFVTEDQQYYIIRKSLTKMQKMCPEYIIRVNGSYLVNISKPFLKGREGFSSLLILDKKIPISKTFKQDLKKCLN